MKVGTRSVLFGAHCFAIHPWFVALAWWKLYGFPRDPRLWVAFFVHDLGYWGKPNMDGPEGETHPELGASLMCRWFDRKADTRRHCDCHDATGFWTWRDFALCHSRFYARRYGLHISRLCVADKLATCLTPRWVYLPAVLLSGEWREYVAMFYDRKSKYAGEGPADKYESRQRRGFWPDLLEWHRHMTAYMRAWVDEHKDGRIDTWTPTANGEGQ